MNFFKRRREELGKTQLEISNAIGMTTSSVSSWENNEKTPRLGIVRELAQVYEVSESRIITEIAKIAAYIRYHKEVASIK